MCVHPHSGGVVGFSIIGFSYRGGVEFLIRKRFNFPEPFRLVRKTLLCRSLLISEDLVRQKSSYEPKCSENPSFFPNSRGRFSNGLLDFRLLDFPVESSPQSQKCGLNYTVNSRGTVGGRGKTALQLPRPLPPKSRIFEVFLDFSGF